MTAWAQTNKCFDQRIQESEAAVTAAGEQVLVYTVLRLSYSAQVERTEQELSCLDYHIKLIKQAIRIKSNPVKVGRTAPWLACTGCSWPRPGWR